MASSPSFTTPEASATSPAILNLLISLTSNITTLCDSISRLHVTHLPPYPPSEKDQFFTSVLSRSHRTLSSALEVLQLYTELINLNSTILNSIVQDTLQGLHHLRIYLINIEVPVDTLVTFSCRVKKWRQVEKRHRMRTQEETVVALVDLCQRYWSQLLRSDKEVEMDMMVLIVQALLMTAETVEKAVRQKAEVREPVMKDLEGGSRCEGLGWRKWSSAWRHWRKSLKR